MKTRLRCCAPVRVALAATFALTAQGCVGYLDEPGLEAHSEAITDTIYEAEEFVAQSGTTVKSTHAGHTGQGYVDYGGKNTWAEWKVQIPTSGTYRLGVRYANGSASARQSALSVDGQTVEEVQFAPTGGWPKWKTTSLELPLGQGSRTLRIRALTSKGGPNIDHLVLECLGSACTTKPQTLELEAVADSYVDSGKPNNNYGRDTTILVDGAPDEYRTLLRFDVPTLTAPVEKATLRLFATNPGNGPKVFPIGPGWGERAVNWNNQPSLKGGVIADFVDVQTGWVEVDVTSAVTKSGLVSFALRPDGDNGVDFDSREGPNAPQLIVETGGGAEPPPAPPVAGEVVHIGTTEVYDSNGQNLTITRPSGSKTGDLLVLFLHRTDDDLPLYVEGWTRIAECYKRDNGYDCSTEDDCIKWHNDDFCADFGKGKGGHDLAQSVFFREVEPGEPNTYTFDLNVLDASGHPGWAILTALRGADTSNPLRDWDNEGCDNNPDSLFPSVYGKAGDFVLLSQSFDDAIAKSKFNPPVGMSTLGYISKSDEAGFLFGVGLEETGQTGAMKTKGAGGPNCKDALVSLTIRAQTPSQVVQPPVEEPPIEEPPIEEPPIEEPPIEEPPIEEPPVDVPEGAISLPIEVLGPKGYTQTVEIDLPTTADITHIYVRCNSCGYGDRELDSDPNLVKATLRVNGGPAIALERYEGGGKAVGNLDLELIGPEKHYGGIGGALRTTRFTVPAQGLKVGKNTFTFEHRDPAPPSIGFRVIDFNLLRKGDIDDRVIPDEMLHDDDPASWAPPLPGQADIDAGRDLWFANNILHDPGLDAMDGQLGGGPNNGDTIASCSDCHAYDGRDLAYFNFSNRSIVERSVFHGLSTHQGEQIASYIRSLDLPVVAQARPWNPPYQPGPGLDQVPVYEWAAGAGLDAVLDEDADMAAYLFPEGTSQPAVREVVDRYGKLNMRELPVALPMPEWNEWLPLVHPVDAFDTSKAAIKADDKGKNVGKPYFEHLYEKARASLDPGDMGDLYSKLKRWSGRNANCFANGSAGGDAFRALNGPVLQSLRLPMVGLQGDNCNENRDKRHLVHGIEHAKRGLAAWITVKAWELMHGNNLESAGASMTDPVCSDGKCVDASEPRGWVMEGDGRHIFDRAAHFVGFDQESFTMQDQLVATAQNSIWYHLAMVLNTGYRKTMPSHFAYTVGYVEKLMERSKVSQSYRYWAGFIKQRQLQTNGAYGTEEGLDLRTAQPFWLWSDKRGRTLVRAGVGETLWRRLVNALLEDFIEDAENATHQDWANAIQNQVVQDQFSTDIGPCEQCFKSTGKPFPFETKLYQGRNTFRVIPKLRELGVNEAVLDALIDWAEWTWPNGPWDDVRAPLPAPRGLYPYSFGGLEDMSVNESANLVSNLGYTGIAVDARGASAIDRLEAYLDYSDAAGDDFEVVAAFLSHRVDQYGLSNAGHKAAIDALAGREGDLWIYFRDDAGEATEAQLTGLIESIVDYASSKQVRVVLYPHVHNVYATAQEALELVEAIDDPNFGLAIHLTHELQAQMGDQLAETFAMVGDRLFAVTLSGADAELDTSSSLAMQQSTIQSLDESGYDLRPYMELIAESGFDGPVGFLNFKLDDPADYLDRSIEAWNALCYEAALYEVN